MPYKKTILFFYTNDIKKHNNNTLYIGQKINILLLMTQSTESQVQTQLLSISGPTTIQASPKNKRKQITKKLRESVWTKRNGESIRGHCWCCKSNITPFDFEAGHVVAISKGGQTTLSNLEAACFSCNRGMSDRNMYEYIDSLTK